MKNKRILLILLLIFFIIGCEKRISHKIEFNNENIEVGQDYKACQLIKKIDEETITKKMIKYNKIILSNGKEFECSLIDNSKVGEIEIKYSFDRQNFTHRVKVVDTKKPTIEAKEMYEVDLGNKYFNIANEVKIKDNYDKHFFINYEHNIDINKAGEYPVIIKAKDNSQNEATKKVIVKVLDKKEKPTNNVTNNTENNNSDYYEDNYYDNSSSNSNSSSSSNNQESSGSNSSANNTNTKAYINGVEDISIAKNSSMEDLIYLLTRNISSSGRITVTYQEVNLSSKGTYKAYYQSSDGVNESCNVYVQ